MPINTFNRFTVIFIITVISVGSSLLITFGIAEVFGNGMDVINVASAIAAPGLIAPIVVGYIVNLLYKIHDLEAEQRNLATFDLLTGLLVRRAVLGHLVTELESVQEKGGALTIAYFDLDDFKILNEKYGHGGGDAVLTDFGQLITQSLRKSDTAGRLGGEEFILLLPGAPYEVATEILNRIRQTIEQQKVKFGSETIHYTTSIGISVYDDSNNVDWNELIAQADQALYQAKHSGKNKIVNFNDKRIAEQQSLERRQT